MAKSSLERLPVRSTPRSEGSLLGPLKSRPCAYTLNELPQPQVDFTCGLLNLKPEPSSVST